ncbi:MAG: hypothetical protein H6742_08360 [Alphaproteobacteria bacterium]|nr:hypothetical protein [Alphaproteobacteria bacterium]
MITLLPLFVACGGGTWVVDTWGEDYIETGIPADTFEDGCSVVFTTFEVEIAQADLIDGDDEVAGSVPTGRFDLVEPGPQVVGETVVTAKHYDTARFAIAPVDGDSVRVAGALTCGAASVDFDWSFDASTTYECEPAELTVPAGGEAGTQLTVHGDHLFYDGLENDDAVVRGQAIVDADGDADGVVTLAELQAVDVAPLGYSVGQFSEVTDLGAFVEHLSRTIGHVDGEGHCAVQF